MFTEIKIVPYDEKYDKVYVTASNREVFDNIKEISSRLKSEFPNEIYQIAFNDATFGILFVTYKDNFILVPMLFQELNKMKMKKPSREDLKKQLMEQYYKHEAERKERNVNIFFDALLDGFEKKGVK
jgi:DNA-binding MarR family transcriptional regulator